MEIMVRQFEQLMNWIRKNWGAALLTSATVGGVVAGIKAKKKPTKDLGGGQSTEGLDPYSVSRLQKLRPEIQGDVIEFLQQARAAGYDLRITDGLRTMQRQAELYAKGRTAPGPRVTNAKPGYSWHNFGLAIDVVPMVNGRPDYNTPGWSEIGRIGEKLGFVWGGRWTTINDKPHFHKTLGYTLEGLRRQMA